MIYIFLIVLLVVIIGCFVFTGHLVFSEADISPAAIKLAEFIRNSTVIKSDIPASGIAEIGMSLNGHYMIASWYTGMMGNPIRDIGFGKNSNFYANSSAPISIAEQRYLTDLAIAKSQGSFSQCRESIADLDFRIKK